MKHPLWEQAKIIYDAYIEDRFEERRCRFDLSGTTLLVYVQTLNNRSTPAEKFVENAGRRPDAPFVWDSVMGCWAVRYEIGYQAWSDPSQLDRYFETGSNKTLENADTTNLRKIVGAPDNVDYWSFGRGNRLVIVFKNPPVLAAQLNPGKIKHCNWHVTADRIDAICKILMARSGVPSKPISFLMQRFNSVFSLERCCTVAPKISKDNLKTTILNLLKDSETDRKILAAFLFSALWEQCIDQNQ